MGAFGRVRHLPETPAAHLVCRRRAHLHGAAPGQDGDTRGVGASADPADQHPPRHRRQPPHLGPAVPFADRASGDVRYRSVTMAPDRRRRERGSISADEILNGAFEVAAEVSVDNLSMPVLARHLDVGVTSIYWYFRRKDELLDTMTDRALAQYKFTVPDIDASNWRESLCNHARTMRKEFLDVPVLCDLVLIRGHYGMRALHGALHEIERPVAAMVEAGLTPTEAAETYGAISVHSRGSVALQRLQQKTE